MKPGLAQRPGFADSQLRPTAALLLLVAALLVSFLVLVASGGASRGRRLARSGGGGWFRSRLRGLFGTADDPDANPRERNQCQQLPHRGSPVCVFCREW